MAKAKKKKASPTLKPTTFPGPVLAPRILEQAAQGWLQATGASTSAPRPVRPASDHRLTEALQETLEGLRAEIAELRARLDRMENR